MVTDVFYPKVLIVGHRPGEYTGVSITLKNLFHNWPSNKLFVAATGSEPTTLDDSDYSFYQLGRKEITSLWGSKDIVSAPLAEDELGSARGNKPKRSIQLSFYTKLFKPLLIKTGLYSIRVKYTVSHELLAWIRDNEIDIIFTMLGNVSSMKFAINLKRSTGRKLAIFILDDWIHSHPNQALFPFIWKHIYSGLFVQVVRLADIHMAISVKMSTEYEKEYCKAFHVFHNPVDMSIFEASSRHVHITQSSFKICYIGKVNGDTIDGLLDLIKALEILGDNRVLLDIYAGSNANKIEAVMGRIDPLRNVRIMSYVSNDQIPNVVMASDLLYLPLGFSKQSRNYTRLSMPTKASEYMASRVPILLYAPDCIALTEYAVKDEWAITICDRNVDLLRKTIVDIMSGEIDTQKFVENAFSLAVLKHQASAVRNDFRKALAKPCQTESN
ncbi:MAG: glycosyltransferase [Gammaproteobacteria bacterium]